MDRHYWPTGRKIWNRHGHKSGVPLNIRDNHPFRRLWLSNARLVEERRMSIIPLLANTSFDPEAVEILSAAFDDAWEKIKQSGSTFARPAYERGAREILAKHIIEMAQRGERDRRQLCESAVKFLAQNYSL
jgi:hypothetical protein